MVHLLLSYIISVRCVTDGELDRKLTMKPVGEIFDMPRIIGAALTLAPPYMLNTSRASWVDLYEVREDAVALVREASVDEIYRLIVEAPRDYGASTIKYNELPRRKRTGYRSAKIA